MSSWQLDFERPAKKALNRLPANLRGRILVAIYKLLEEPFPAGSTKLVGFDNLYRIRVGDWRVLYTVKHEILTILIVDVGPRGRIYRNL